MIDALWIAASGVDYFMTDPYLALDPTRLESVTLRWVADAHPCDDLPYVAGITMLAAQFDG